MRKLKPQYEDFCRSYSDDSNAFGAAVAAGYSRKSAYTTGCRLLTRPEIVARIQELRRITAERESLHAPALLAKLETAYAQAVAAKNPVAIVRVIELQAKIAGLVGARRDMPTASPADEEIDREIAALDIDEPPASARPRERKPQSKPPSKFERKPVRAVTPPAEPVAPAPAADAEPVLMPTVGHDEPPPVTQSDDVVASPDVAHDGPTSDEELRRQEIRRLALEAVARSRTRKRLRLSA